MGTSTLVELDATTTALLIQLTELGTYNLVGLGLILFFLTGWLGYKFSGGKK